MMGCPSFLFLQLTKESQTCERVNMKYVQQISPFCFARKSPMEPLAFIIPHSALREKVRWSHLHSVMSNKQTQKKNSVNTRASWRSHSLRRMKCLNRLLCIYVYYMLRYIYRYIRDVYTICFQMFYVSVLRRICVHELPLYVYLERFGANLFMFRILI